MSRECTFCGDEIEDSEDAFESAHCDAVICHLCWISEDIDLDAENE